MERQPRIRSRRLLDEQDRTARQPMSDQDAPGRIPVAVLANQMAQFGMHSKFDGNGMNVNVLRDLRERGITIEHRKFTPQQKAVAKVQHKPKKEADEIKRLRQEGWASVEDVAPLYGVSAATMRQFVNHRNIRNVRVGRRLFYPLEHLATYKRTYSNSTRIVMPDGREFRSFSECAQAHGMSRTTLRERCVALGVAQDGGGIVKALAWNPKPGKRPTL